MQVTRVAAVSVRLVLREVSQGRNVAGYTDRPCFSNGLFIYGKCEVARKDVQYPCCRKQKPC